MTYELAPATQLLATHCAACGRPLVDAASVTAGMGPDCRQKYGVPELLADDARAEANALIYAVARDQTGPTVAAALNALRALGCSAIADRIQKRIAPAYVAVIAADGELHFYVKASFDVSSAAELGRVRGGRWDAGRKVRVFPVSAKLDVFKALKRACTGLCLGPRGEFTL